MTGGGIEHHGAEVPADVVAALRIHSRIANDVDDLLHYGAPMIEFVEDLEEHAEELQYRAGMLRRLADALSSVKFVQLEEVCDELELLGQLLERLAAGPNPDGPGLFDD